MKTLLLDTSIIIDFLRRKSERKATILYTLTEQDYSFAISLLTYAELYAGKSIWQDRKAAEELEKILSYIEIIPFEKEVAKEAGKLRTQYAMDAVDAIIATTAIIHNFPLVTLNIKHFKSVKELQLFALS